MIPPVHFLISYLISSLLTKNALLRRLAAIGGVIPDLDGIFILFDHDLYARYHHILFHPLMGGMLLGTFTVAVFWIYEKGRNIQNPGFGKYFIFFFVGLLLHDFADIIGTDWQIPLLYPASSMEFSVYPSLSSEAIYGVIDPIVAVIFLLAAFIQPLIERRSVMSFFSEKIDKRFVGALRRWY